MASFLSISLVSFLIYMFSLRLLMEVWEQSGLNPIEGQTHAFSVMVLTYILCVYLFAVQCEGTFV